MVSPCGAGSRVNNYLPITNPPCSGFRKWRNYGDAGFSEARCLRQLTQCQRPAARVRT
jgi:hypothetical protein